MRDPNWVALTDAQKGQLVCIWMLAADNNGKVPSSPALIKRLCCLEHEPDLTILMSLGFLDAKMTPRRRQYVVLESETETETETEESKIYRSNKKKDGLPMKDEDWSEEFWKVYPRRIGKKAALEALDRIRRSGVVPRDKFMEGVWRYADYAKTKNIKYIKHPKTWLNQGCWEDELTSEEYMNGDSHRERSLKERMSDALQRLGSGSPSEIIDLGLPEPPSK